MEDLIFLSLDLGMVLERLEKQDDNISESHLYRGFNEVCRRLGSSLSSSKYQHISGRRGVWGFMKLIAPVNYTGYSWLRHDAEVAVAIAAMLDSTHDSFFDHALNAIVANILHSLSEPEWEIVPDTLR